MKNRMLSLLASIVLLSFSSCTDEMQEIASQEQQVLKQIVMTTQDFVVDTNSRTTFEISEGAVNCTWAKNDTVGVFPDTGMQTCFPMASESGTNSATFDGGGWALKDGKTYAAYYPFIGKMYLDINSIPVSYVGQSQTGNNSVEHLGAYDYMVATPTAPKFGSTHFMFKHLSAMVQLRITVPKPSTFSSLKLIAETKAFAVKGEVDIMVDAPSITSAAPTNEVELDLQDVATTKENEVLIFYLMLPPADLSEQSLKAILVSDEGNLEANLKGKNFQSGTAYGLSGEIAGTQIGYKDGVVRMDEAGTMKELLGDDYLKITSLKVVGSINGDDVYALREMLGGHEIQQFRWGNLAMLDLSEVTIVGGGRSYYEYSSYLYGTSNNIIGPRMFYWCEKLQKIVLPNSVTSIGIEAFDNCKALLSVAIGNAVTSIGTHAFRECDMLFSISIPNSVISIGKYAFSHCSSLKNIELSEGVTEIKEGTFNSCSSLLSIEMSDNVILIGDLAFNDCQSLISIDISDNILSIGRNAFNGCYSLTSIDLPNGVTFIGNYAFNSCKSLVSIKIPSGVSSINNGVFAGCYSLTSIDIPDSVTSIGQFVFSSCSSLSSIKIGKGVASVGYDAFSGCEALTSVYITDLSAWCGIQFSNGDYSNPLNYGIKLYLNEEELKELVIPKGVTEIKSKVFMGCKSLTKVMIGNDVQTIGWAAFTNCKALISVDILDGVTTVDASAFSGCTSLTSVTIDADITSIKDATFQYCNSLSKISISEGVTSIGAKAFGDSSNITEFYCYATNPPSFIKDKYEGTFSTGDFKNRVLYVPKGSAVIYSSSKWNEIFSIIKEM